MVLLMLALVRCLQLQLFLWWLHTVKSTVCKSHAAWKSLQQCHQLLSATYSTPMLPLRFRWISVQPSKLKRFQDSSPVFTQFMSRSEDKQRHRLALDASAWELHDTARIPTPGVEPAQHRAVPTGGGDVGALMARLWMPQTHIYDRHT